MPRDYSQKRQTAPPRPTMPPRESIEATIRREAGAKAKPAKKPAKAKSAAELRRRADDAMAKAERAVTPGQAFFLHDHAGELMCSQEASTIVTAQIATIRRAIRAAEAAREAEVREECLRAVAAEGDRAASDLQSDKSPDTQIKIVLMSIAAAIRSGGARKGARKT